MRKIFTISVSLFLVLAVFIPGGFVSALSFGNSIYLYTYSVQDLTQTSATLKGTVNPRDISTKVWFEWGSSADGLIYATPPQTIGSRNASIDVLAGIGNLSPNSVYYYRAVAKNQDGIFYGSTINFRTKSYSASGNSSSDGFFSTNKASASEVAPALMSVIVSADKTKVDRGEEFVLTVKYQNVGFSDADDVVLKVELPKETELRMTAPFCYYFDKNALVFNLGRVKENSAGEINIQSKISDSARFGKDLETIALLSFTDTSNSSKEKISDTLQISVVEKEATSMPASVGFFSSHYGTWFLLSFVANLFLAFYIFSNRKKEDEILKI